MAQTQVRSAQIGSGEVKRSDLDVTTSGSAVVAKLVAGTNVTFSSTGPDAGTGDVTINASGGGSSTPQIILANNCDVLNRFARTTGGSGSNAINSGGGGLSQSLASTTSDYAKALWMPSFGGLNIVSGSPSICIATVWDGAMGDHQAFWGVGTLTVSAASITFTGQHFGFKTDRTSPAGSPTIYATNANGTTQTQTSFTPTDYASDTIYFAKKTSTTDIKFYSDRTLRATHTTNLPTNAEGMELAITCKGVASAAAYRIGAMTYTNDAF